MELSAVPASVSAPCGKLAPSLIVTYLTAAGPSDSTDAATTAIQNTLIFTFMPFGLPI